MDWLSDALSRLVSWYNMLVNDVLNFVIAHAVNPLFEIWNSMVDKLLDPVTYLPRFGVVMDIIEALAFAGDYIQLMWLLVDSVSYAWLVSRLISSYLLFLPFALFLRGWFIVRRAILVS